MSARARTRARARDRDGGFTLVELTVALVAGLIVALGIVTLSKESTRTFHEEVRSAAAEAGLRTAVDRLRADLGRAGYMSTGNIMTDPLVAKAPTLAAPAYPPSMAGLQRLAAIRLQQGGSVANVIPLSATNGLTPDLLEIGGNMTSSDMFEVQVVNAPDSSCQRINLSAVTPSMYRVTAVGGAQAAQELRNLFQPVPATLNTQFIVRIVDDTGRTQYAATCKDTAAAWIDAAGPYIKIDSNNTPLQTAESTGTVGSYTGLGSGKLWVNPVQIVRWEIASSGTGADKVPAQSTAALGAQPSDQTTDPNKYDLMRSFVDVSGALVPETSEIIAEYAVDLDFAFSVETGTNLNPSIVTFPFDDTTNTPLWAQNVATQTLPAIQQPQRIRSVRARVATRTAQSDRGFSIPVPNSTGPFLYRYCMLAAGCDATNARGLLQYARVRTLTIEVAIPNSARSYYQ